MRRATPADVPELVTLMAEFYAESAMPLDADRARASFEALLAQPVLGAAWVVETDDRQVAGYLVATFTFSMEYGGSSAFIDDLFIRPAFRRRGLARAALEAALAECRARGVQAVHLEVGGENDPARQLYDQVGFEASDRLLLTARLAPPAPPAPPAQPATP